jgi:type I restriction enzyme M protein
LTSIVWLYRGQHDRFVALVAEHLHHSVEAARSSVATVDAFTTSLSNAAATIVPFLEVQTDAKSRELASEIDTSKTTLISDAKAFAEQAKRVGTVWSSGKRDNNGLHVAAEKIAKSAEASHDLIRQLDHVMKLHSRAVDLAEKELGAKENGIWSSREVKAAAKALDEVRQTAVEQLKLVRYFYRHAHWLQERFPEAELRDVEGLVKLVSHVELEKNDWSLTSGRYVGVAPEEEDEDFDLEETLREIHIELRDLNAEAVELAAKIAKNFETFEI